MKNLKRALSFALASVMLVGMMVVGASAVSFGDADKIVNTDAVNTLVTLGVLKGKDTGNFDPEGIVTRAEMAKMICVAMNGGKDPNLVGGTLFPDTKGHWAGGYIDYCANQGIVSGDTAGNFNPDKTVTGTEAAKMILIALGFNAETEKFVNDVSWATNISVRASQKGLYEELAILANDGLTRDNAAQMIYNGMQAVMVKYEMVGIVGGNGVSQAVDVEPNSGKDTILKSKFDMKTGYGYMTKVEYDADDKEYTYTVDAAANFGSDAITGTDALAAKTFTSAQDLSHMLGMQVKALYKETTTKTTLYGFTAYKSSVVATGVAGDVDKPKTDATEVKIDGTKYKLTDAASATPVFDAKFEAPARLTVGIDLSDADNGYTITAVDNTGDGKIDAILKVPFTVAKVTYVGANTVTMDKGVGSIDKEDANLYDGIAKSDYVLYTAAAYIADGMENIAKAEVNSATVTGKKNSEYQIGGTWYKLADGVTVPSMSDTIDYIAMGGYLYYTKVTSGAKSLDNMAMVITFGVSDNVSSGKVKLLLSDGTKTTVTLTSDSYKPTSGDCGKLYTYDLDGSEYKLTALPAAGSDVGDYTVKAGTLSSTTGSATASGKATYITDNTHAYEVADSAVIFLYKGATTNAAADNDAKIITGKELKTLSIFANTTAGVKTATMGNLVETSNGFTKVAVLAAQSTLTDDYPVASSADNYGYLTADAYQSKEGNDTYRVFTMWNGEEEVTVREKTAGSIETFTARTLISYDTVDADNVKNVVVAANTHKAAVRGLEDNTISFDGSTTFKLTGDTKYMYVNTADKKGVNGGELTRANNPASGVYEENVIYVLDGATDVGFILVDVNNKLEDATEYTVAAAPSNDTYYTYSVSPVADSKVQAGDTIKLTITKKAADNASHAVVTVTPTDAVYISGGSAADKATFAENALADQTITLTYMVTGAPTFAVATGTT